MKFRQRSQLSSFVAQNVAPKNPGKNDICLIADMSPRWNGEDEIQLFQGTLFGFWHQAEDQTKGQDIESTLKKWSASFRVYLQDVETFRRKGKLTQKIRTRL